VAVSPDVGPFIHRRYRCGDLLQRSVIRNVAPSASSVILTVATGRAHYCRPWPFRRIFPQDIYSNALIVRLVTPSALRGRQPAIVAVRIAKPVADG
jgi:hypothetical protein